MNAFEQVWLFLLSNCMYTVSDNASSQAWTSTESRCHQPRIGAGLKLPRGLVLRLALIFRSMEHSISQASSSSKPAMATSLSDVTGRAETARGSHGKPLRPRPSRRSKATQQSHFGTPQTPSRPGSQACTDLQVNGAFHIPGILIIKTGHGHQFI